MVFLLMMSGMYLKLTILLPNWKVDGKKMGITFVGNSHNILYTTSKSNISLADNISRVCWQMQQLKSFNKTN